MAATVRDFPLFPLGIVTLPSEVVPLHIFEERFKTMIGECLERESEFGIVWLSDDGLRPIGCAVEIEEVLA
jgi:Lon protease-like protein